MPSETPTEGRCNADTERGFCEAYPVREGTRCYRHGGRMQRFAARMRHLDEEAKRQVDEAIQDPDLMDVRRPLALAEVVIANSPIVPTDELVHRMAQRRVSAQMGKYLAPMVADFVKGTGDAVTAELLREAIAGMIEPTDADLQDAAMELHERSMRLLSSYSKRQVEAVRQLEWSKTMRELALPFLQELGLKLSGVLRRFVPEDQLPAALEETRKALTIAVGELSSIQTKGG